MKKQIIFKFRHSEIINLLSKKELLEDFNITKKPLNFNNLPNGEYYIRTTGITYLLKDNIWYLVNTKKLNIYDIWTTYELHPILSNKQYLELLHNYKYLSKYWKLNVNSYFQWKNLNNQKRELNLSFKKIS